MKKNIILSIITAFVLSACSDFLDYNENTDYTQEQVYTLTWGNAEIVQGLYQYLPGSFNDVDGAIRSSGCDESEYVWAYSGIHTYYNGTWSPMRTIDDKWATYYAAIRKCNDYLEHGTGLTWDQFKYATNYQSLMLTYKNREWEVKALRAYFYFELVKRYRNIPLVTKVLTEDEANKQVPVDFQTIIDFIVASCDEATIPTEEEPVKLPAIYDASYGSQTGRVSKVFACALKARALLYAASPLNNPDAETNPEKWIKAAEAAKMIMDSAQVWNVGLDVSFDNLLGPNNYTSKEMILAKRLGDLNYYESFNFPIGIEGGNSGNCPTQNLVDAFGMQARKTFNPDKPYENRDKRLPSSVLCNGQTTAYGQTVDIKVNGANGQPKQGATKTGYYLNKFVNNNISLTKANTTTARHSFPLFRYAEVLLIYAEAMNEAYGPSGTSGNLDITALRALNQVQARVSATLTTAAMVPAKEDLRKAIQKERMVELAFEDHRFWDIRRWKIGPETTKIKRVKITEETPGSEILKYEYYETNDRIWNDKMYFYPIPQSEIDKNKNLVQNKGW